MKRKHPMDSDFESDINNDENIKIDEQDQSITIN